MPVLVSAADGVALMRLELGRGNAIGPAFITELDAALHEAEGAGARAIVLTGRGRVFCAGLDLVTLGGFDRTQMQAFGEAFEGMFRRVLGCPIPVVAAVNGHALAGGCILAMACDMRVMDDGPFQIGVNEVHLGIPFPPVAFEIVHRVTPPGWRSAVLVQGRRFSPREAETAGLVHRVVPEGTSVTVALEEARLYASAGPDAVRAVKADLVSRDAPKEDRSSRFVDAWFAPDAQERIAAVRAAISSKRG